ncbi:MAG: carbohydrate kinase family protein [Patescibacteria group bacterium]|nr:carbohydrate kinase family protein [Patescibacteria group bacterium]
MYHILTIGDAVVDTHVKIDNASVECDVDTRECQLCLDYASKIPITDSFQTLGGNAANVACGAAKLGLASAILTSIGKDSNGRMVKQELKKNNVATELVETDAKTKTRYSVVLNFRGERTILSYHEKRNYRWPKKMPATEWVYYTSLSEGYEPLQNELIKFLTKHPAIKVAFNPGSFQLKSKIERVKEVIGLTDVLIVNLEEAERITGITLAKEKSVSGLIHELIQLGAEEVVITDAAAGATAGNVDEIWTMPALPVTVVAKTGAGDAFSSAYIAARIYDHDIPHALAWGAANSAGVISDFGAQKGLLDVKGIKKMSEKFPNIKPKQLV